MANVAQLVEPRFVVPVVVGSSPIVRPSFYKVFGSDTFFLCFPAGRVESAEREAAKTSRGGFRLGQ